MSNSNGSNPSLPRKATKKTSFLSLRKEKKSTESPSVSVSPRHSPSGNYTTSPSSFQHFDYEDYQEPRISRPYQLSGYHSRSASKSATSVRNDGYSKREQGRGRQEKASPPDQSFDFPTVNGDSSFMPFSEDVKVPWPRPRCQTNPSERQDSDPMPFVRRSVKYPFRDSGSSSLSQFDPLPQTPIDDNMSFHGSVFNIPVMVAAPVSGVETMDALVDGMNGFSSDDHFMGSGGISGRTKISKTGHHPLYHPPLPTPPPGITLGKATPRKGSKPHESSSDDESPYRSTKRGQRHKNHRPASSRHASNTTVTRSTLLAMPSKEDISLYSGSSISDESLRPPPPPPPSISTRTVAPSISEIIRAHAPASQQARSRPSSSHKTSYAHSSNHGSITQEKVLPPPSPLITDDETDFVSRSSVDTIAEEVRQTIRNQARASVVYPCSRPTSSYSHVSPPSTVHENSRGFSSPKPESRRGSSIYSHSTSTISDQPHLPPLDLQSLTKTAINSPSQTIAQYLRSSRLTSILRLTRSPHASRETPLNVSFSDLGSPSGHPLVIFLGLGCVRQIMGLYDEMAECLGLRLITIDRWGLGRTDTPRAKSAKGIPEWACVVEEVLDRLQIDQCSVMAHSAGAPYALAFANRFPERIRGDICLLAPWVGGGEGGGYKWLKYVPNGILKTAQAAEWKVQAWMLGKPPTLAYEGIGFDVKISRPSTANSSMTSRFHSSPPASMDNDTSFRMTQVENEPRHSISSGIFSDYDDLHDFDGRFESRSTLGRRSTCSQRSRINSESHPSHVSSRKPSKGFLGRLKGGGSPLQAHSPKEERPTSSSGSGKRLKALRSMGSLKGRSSSSGNPATKKTQSPPPPSLPQPLTPEVGLGLDELDWSGTVRGKSLSTPPAKSGKAESVSSMSFSNDGHSNPRSGGRRSVSGPTKSPVPPVPPLPSSPIADNTPYPTSSYQAALGNALIAASHAESAKGTHGDLVQILNHDRQPWGFSYSAYPHCVRVWYGDRDDRIAENVVRWMENTMGSDKCSVKVVKGADHALMFKSSVVVEVMEYMSDCWRLD
ncbi:unnamed protein product [Somion occarium]|uniref:AB hydrolase-1 domain-containing protein n=1 Tax=Somion occarium TaxID=3059160 RepID=A0ABP1CNI8_9APHY